MRNLTSSRVNSERFAGGTVVGPAKSRAEMAARGIMDGWTR
jgi:hypothetical protein